jgi:hypothetical protein
MIGSAITRRGVLAGAGASSLVRPAAASQAARAERRFTILRGGDEIGRHVIALERRDGFHYLSVDVDIAVRILGLVAYRYTMRNREVWRDGLLQSIESDVDDDGAKQTLRVRREDSLLHIEGAAFRGTAPDRAATTTYFTPDFLRRGSWIDTEDGDVYAMTATQTDGLRLATGAGESVDCAGWRVTNGGAFDATLYYDSRGEWASIAFDARGEPGTYVPDDLNDSFAAVWSA